MVDILHRVGVKVDSQQKVYEAITTIEGLAAWWTEDTKGDPRPGGIIEFRFPPGGFDMKIIESTRGKQVRWEVVEGPTEWVGTTIDWTLHTDGEFVIVMFAHRGWAEPVEFMHHCSTKWATYLISLKQLVETGTGAPSPRDIHIAYPD